MKTFKKILCTLLVVVMCLTSVPLIGIDFKAEATEYSVGDIIEFGSYPQTQVTDSSLISALNSISATWRSYGYMSGAGSNWCDGSAKASDYMKYKDVTYNNERYRAVEFSTYRPGLVTYKSTENCFNHQASNGYTINNVYWFKFEPIQWRILDPSKGLVLCNSVIDSQAFNNNLYATGNTSTWWADYWKDSARTIHANNYAKSDIKEWLNDDFYYTAFTEANRKLIDTQTNGKICLLTRGDTTNSSYGFTNDESRKAYGTDYAKAQGLLVSGGTSIWMTQSAASSLGINISCVYFDGHTFDRESNDYGHTSMTFHGVRPAMCVDLDAVTSSKVFPEGYDFEEDSYGFGNYGDKSLSKKYFTSLFNSANAEAIYKSQKNSSEGLCCGFAYTTAAFFNGLPSVAYSLGDAEIVDTLRKVDNNYRVMIGSNEISVDDYIKYAFVYQYSEDVFQQRQNTTFVSSRIDGTESFYNPEGIFELYDLVKSVTSNDNLGVIIWLNHLKIPSVENPSCHTVLCVGVDDDSIIIDDSNLRSDHHFEDELSHLRINEDGSWVYEPYNGRYNSQNTHISYAMDYHKPYSILSTGNKVDGDDYWINSNPGNSYIVGCEKIDAGKGILYCDADNYQLNNIEKTEFLDVGAGENYTKDTSKLYWINSEDVIEITNIRNDSGDSKFYISSGDTITEAIVSDDSSITFNTDNSIIIDTSISDEYTVSYSHCFENENYEDKVITVTVSGIASSETISGQKTSEGVEITGISDGTITLTIDDEVIATQTITDAEGDIDITYDKNGNSDTLEVEYDSSASDKTEIENCSCNCHKGGISGFFFKLILFFQKIFRTNKTCSCGVNHY